MGITTEWLEERISQINKKIELLEEERGHLVYVLNLALSEQPPPAEPRHPFNLGAVEGTVELLKKTSWWLTKKEIGDAFVKGGYPSRSKNPVEVIASTLNGEITKKTKKNRLPRVIRENGRYGLPGWEHTGPAYVKMKARHLVNREKIEDLLRPSEKADRFFEEIDQILKDDNESQLMIGKSRLKREKFVNDWLKLNGA